MPLTCLRWMARTFAASGLMTGYGRAGRRCLRPLVIRCGSIDARQRGVPTRRPIRTDPMRRCMTMARSRGEPRLLPRPGARFPWKAQKFRAARRTQLAAAPRHCRRASIARLAKDRSNASADVLRCSREWIGIEMRRNRGDPKSAVSIQTEICWDSHRMEKSCNLLTSCRSGRAEVLHSSTVAQMPAAGAFPIDQSMVWSRAGILNRRARANRCLMHRQ